MEDEAAKATISKEDRRRKLESMNWTSFDGIGSMGRVGTWAEKVYICERLELRDAISGPVRIRLYNAFLSTPARLLLTRTLRDMPCNAARFEPEPVSTKGWAVTSKTVAGTGRERLKSIFCSGGQTCERSGLSGWRQLR